MIKAIIFDVDGVLLDSFESNLSFYQELMKVAGYPQPTRAQYLDMNHLPMWDVIRILTKLTDDAKIMKIWKQGKALLYDGVPPVMPDGAADAVKNLSVHYQLGIVTSRVREHIFTEAGLGDIKKYFKAAVGYEDTAKHKPFPDPLLLAAKKLKVLPEECVYIGDALTDVQAGNAAGMRVIFYGKERPEGAIANAKDFKEIVDVIKTLK